jgi:hypothetical protein
MKHYTAIPNQLFHDLREGKINSTMFLILSWLYKHANYRTGVAKHVSAPRIQAEMWADEYDKAPTERTIQKWMKVLGLARYITSQHTPNSRRSYPVLLHNYPTVKRDENGNPLYDAEGFAEEIVLNPTDTLDYRETDISSCAETCADGDNGACADPSNERALSLPRIHSLHSPSHSPVTRLSSPEEEDSEGIDRERKLNKGGFLV